MPVSTRSRRSARSRLGVLAAGALAAALGASAFGAVSAAPALADEAAAAPAYDPEYASIAGGVPGSTLNFATYSASNTAFADPSGTIGFRLETYPVNGVDLLDPSVPDHQNSWSALVQDDGITAKVGRLGSADKPGIYLNGIMSRPLGHTVEQPTGTYSVDVFTTGIPNPENPQSSALNFGARVGAAAMPGQTSYAAITTSMMQPNTFIRTNWPATATPTAPAVTAGVVDGAQPGLNVRAWHLPEGGTNTITIADGNGKVVASQEAPHRPSSAVVDGVQTTVTKTLMGNTRVLFTALPDTDTVTVTQNVNGYVTSATTVDWRPMVTGSMSGVAYVDANENGVRDADEAVLANADVTITGTVAGTPVETTVTTDDEGRYTASLLAGLYSADVSLPAGHELAEHATTESITDAQVDPLADVQRDLGITAMAAPVEPTEPVDPTEPTDPTDPVTPTDPTDPVTPVDPTQPVTPTDPTTPVDPANPVVVPSDPIVTDVPAVDATATSASSDDRLASTGLDTGVIIPTAVALVLLGLVLAVAKRRRPATES